MKKKNLKSLTLNKRSISQLHGQKGGDDAFTTDQITMSTCTCVSCLPTGCNEPSAVICPPPFTRFCTIDCVTRDCSFGIVCPIPIDVK
ncbi:MAG: hypothetical protein AAF617_14215 [Bacteroidota bacterium]